MSNVQTILLDDIQASLIEQVRSGLHGSVLDDVFASWLLGYAATGLDAKQLLQKVLSASRTPRETAALGVLARSNLLDDSATTVLLTELQQLLGREPVIAGTPMPFCMDGLSLGGILLGIDSLQDPSLKSPVEGWLNSCRNVTASGRGLGSWQEAFVESVATETGCSWPLTVASIGKAPVVTVAMRSVGIGATDDVDRQESDEQSALNIIRSGTPQDGEWFDAVLRLAALEWIRRSRPITELRNVSVSELCDLLRRTPDALQYWTWEDHPRTKTAQIRKWHIDHEYHVQNLLWTILSPVFPDLVPEDYTVKIGKKQPRADLGIPSLRVIVEAKFWYTKHGSKKMIEEIAQDTGLYLVPGCRYDSIVPIIWDEGRRTEEHKGLIAALKQMDGISDAVVIAKPGNMQ